MSVWTWDWSFSMIFEKWVKMRFFAFWLNWMRCIDRSSLVIWQKRLNMGIKSFSMSTQMYVRVNANGKPCWGFEVHHHFIFHHNYCISVSSVSNIQFNTAHVSIILSTMWSIIDRSIIEYQIPSQIRFPCLAILCFISFFQIIFRFIAICYKVSTTWILKFKQMMNLLFFSLIINFFSFQF